MEKIVKIKEWFIYTIVFIAGAIILILEILGTRILAPFYGTTVYVWAATITVTLFSLALGYFSGGYIADKFKKNILNILIFFSGTFIITIPFIKTHILLLSESLDYKFGIFFSCLIIFSMPLILLGAVTPYALKMVTEEFLHLGIKAGKLYAISTVGSLAGAIVTVFFLIPFFGIKSILFGIGFLLIIISFIFIFLEKSNKIYLIFYSIFFPVIYLLLTSIPRPYFLNETEIKYVTDTPYFNLKVIQQKNIRSLILDGCLQSDYDVSQKSFIVPYLKLFAKTVERQKDIKNILILGLGGGGAQSYLKNKDIKIDFVEIDKKVVDIAKEYFNFNGTVYIDDARYFIKRSQKKYDIILADIYGAFVFYHYVLSKEAIFEMKKILNENGIFVINLIGNVDSKTFYCDDNYILAVNETLKTNFRNIRLIATNSGISNILIYASDNDIKIADGLEVKVKNKGVTLTDDYNPFDLMAKKNLKQLWKNQILMLGREALL